MTYVPMGRASYHTGYKPYRCFFYTIRIVRGKIKIFMIKLRILNKMKQKNYFLLIAQILLNLPSLIYVTLWIMKISIVMDAELFSYLLTFIRLSSYIASLFSVATLINLLFIRDMKTLLISVIISIFTLLFSAYTLSSYACNSFYGYYMCLVRDYIFKIIH